MIKAFEKLMDISQHISALEQASGMLQWDQEVMMPKKGANMRAQQLKALALVVHEKMTDPIIGELLAQAEEETPNSPHLQVIKKKFNHATKLPAALVGELSMKISQAQIVWIEARHQQDFSIFEDMLTEVVRLTAAQADCLADVGQSRYDVLLGEYELGMESKKLEDIFATIKIPLMTLRKKIQNAPQIQNSTSFISASQQLEFANRLMNNFNFDSSWSRLDQSVHPFSTGHFDDCRITTRIDENDPFESIYSTIHEMGHALYEHNIHQNIMGMPAGIYASMGIHESQSRFAENQIGRSRAYMDWLLPAMASCFDAFEINDPEMLYRLINRVETGYIRTEADEVHYNLHIILRYELERDLFCGDIKVSDLEAEWNRRFHELFGLDVPNAALGVLQDIHWAMGGFGYFPTYALGNIYAACLNEQLRKDHPHLDQEIQNGKHQSWQKWMCEHIHQYGRMKAPAALITDATGKTPNAQPLIHYLEQKFGMIYNL